MGGRSSPHREITMTDHGAQAPAVKTVESTWAEQARWSETANRLRARTNLWRNGAAVAGVDGAFFAPLAAGAAFMRAVFNQGANFSAVDSVHAIYFEGASFLQSTTLHWARFG